MHYKFSKYNKWGYIGKGRVFLYNTFSSSVAILTEEEFSAIHSESIVMNDTDMLFRTCSTESFIVPANENELAKLMAIRNANNFCTSHAGFQILPTTGCNACCFYCYEQDFVSETMSEATIEATIAFILRYCENVADVNITWFGGEPLLCEDIIAKISKELLVAFESKGIGYGADIITNGSRIDKDCANRLKNKYKVNSVQITLDGQGDEYLRRKAYIEKDISYERVLDSIALLADSDIDVLVRLNIDRENIDSCLHVLDDLSQLQTTIHRIWPYAAPLYSDRGYEHCFSRQELNNAFMRVFTHLIDRGFITSVNGLPTSFMNAACCAKGLNNFVISPSGEISKCEHLLNTPAEVIGTVYSGITFTDALSSWTDSKIPERCGDCSLLPLCQAGCEAAERRGFGYGRCSYIAFIDDAVLQAATYLLQRKEESI